MVSRFLLVVPFVGHFHHHRCFSVSHRAGVLFPRSRPRLIRFGLRGLLRPLDNGLRQFFIPSNDPAYLVLTPDHPAKSICFWPQYILGSTRSRFFQALADTLQALVCPPWHRSRNAILV
jgi:hypothetical protein